MAKSSWRDTLPVHDACKLFEPLPPDELRLLGQDNGAALRLHDDGWALSTGMLVDADIANVVIAGPRIAPVDYALFAEPPAQTWRWVGTDLFCVKPTGGQNG
jgi:hypothetical protein